MEVIDLLNKIANGEEVPKQIKARGVIWEFDKKYNDYHNDEEWFFISGFDEFKNSKEFLELKVEIIEEDKEIEELRIKQEKNIKNNWKWKIEDTEHDYNISTPQKIMGEKINELIKAVNELKKSK